MKKQLGRFCEVFLGIHPGMAPIIDQAFKIYIFSFEIVNKLKGTFVEEVFIAYTDPEQFQLLIGDIRIGTDLTEIPIHFGRGQVEL